MFAGKTTPNWQDDTQLARLETIARLNKLGAGRTRGGVAVSLMDNRRSRCSPANRKKITEKKKKDYRKKEERRKRRFLCHGLPGGSHKSRRRRAS
jgi:hypothetical protein